MVCLRGQLDDLTVSKAKLAPLTALQERAFRNILPQKEHQTKTPGTVKAKNVHGPPETLIVPYTSKVGSSEVCKGIVRFRSSQSKKLTNVQMSRENDKDNLAGIYSSQSVFFISGSSLSRIFVKQSKSFLIHKMQYTKMDDRGVMMF